MIFDIIIKNAFIYDGSGKLPFYSDIGIKDGRIHSICDLKEAKSVSTIYAENLSLCPGFIDVHSHADMTIFSKNHEKLVKPLVSQGITTLMGGNCGITLSPISDKNSKFQFDFYEIFKGEDQKGLIKWQSFEEMVESFESQGSLCNVGLLAPHGIFRMHTMGDKITCASQNEISEMKKELEKCLEAGAFGMSTGLMYFPGLFSDPNELLELCKVVYKYDGILASHMRSYNSDTIGKAIDEILTLGLSANIPVQISHLFCVPNFSKPINFLASKVLKIASRVYDVHKFKIPKNLHIYRHMKKIANLIDKGFPIGIDAMPTGAGFTHLFAFFPPWSVQGGVGSILKRIADVSTRNQIRQSIENGRPIWPHRKKDTWSMNLFKVMGWDSAFIMSLVSEKNQKYVGKSFVEIAKVTGKHPFDVICDIALEENGKVLIFITPTHPQDSMIERLNQDILIDPNVSIVTDTILLGFGKPSHLFYDCYPKFISEYAVKYKLLSFSEVIRKCTSLPAKQMQIKNRGLIKKGNWADIVMFNSNTIRSNSTFNNPAQFPSGIEYVFVNGSPVITPDGYNPKTRSGKILKRKSS